MVAHSPAGVGDADDAFQVFFFALRVTRQVTRTPAHGRWRLMAMPLCRLKTHRVGRRHWPCVGAVGHRRTRRTPGPPGPPGPPGQEPRSRRMTHLLERHHHCQRVNQEQRSNQKPLLRIARTIRSSRMFSYHSRHNCWQYKRLSWLWMRMETRLANGVINRWTLLLTLVKGNQIHLLFLCKSSRSRLLTLCEGSRRCLVFVRSRSTVTMRKRRFMLQNLLS